MVHAQTSEHLAAVEIMRLTNIIILQNKIGARATATAAAAKHTTSRACCRTVTQTW